MRGCDTEEAVIKIGPAYETLVLKVEDMTCSHCASAVTRALEAGLPGTRVHADLATRLVTVRGAQHPGNIVTLIRSAGYTPCCAPLG